VSATVYYSEDVDKSYIEDKKIAIIGYGSQGRGQAQNLNDSGYDVVVGLREGSSSREVAEEDGLEVMDIEKAAKRGDVVQVLIPDNVQPEVYQSQIEPGLEAGDALFFSHGFNIHYNQIQPPENADVVMVAPKGPGNLVRRVYTEGQGVPALLAIYQDYTGEAKDTGLAYAHGLGATRPA